MHLGASMYYIILIFLGLVSMPLSETMYPKNLPSFIPKMYFLGLNFIPTLSNTLKTYHHVISVHLNRGSDQVFENPDMSLWQVVPAFFNPKGITL